MKQGWEIKKFGEVFNLQMGKTPNRDNRLYWGGNNIWISISDIKDRYIGHSKESITDLALKESNIKKVKSGTVIMSFKLTVGRAAITTTDLYTNEAIMAFMPNDGYNILSEYTYYYLSHYKWENSNKAVMGITLNKKVISDSYFEFPPRAEQERIVGELDCLSGIIADKRAQLRELDTLAQSIFYTMFGDPITNDKGWQTKKLGDVCDTTSGGTPSKKHAEYYENGTIPWLRSGEIDKTFISSTELCITEQGVKNSSAKWFPINTVVIAMYGATVGQVGILKAAMTTNQAICGIFPNDIFASVYLYYFLRSMKAEFIKLSSGGAQPNISQSIIRDTIVSCPPIFMQQQFAEKIENIERQKELITKSIKETEDLFNSRMDYYFN